jgi:hypothetical protein
MNKSGGLYVYFIKTLYYLYYKYTLFISLYLPVRHTSGVFATQQAAITWHQVFYYAVMLPYTKCFNCRRRRLRHHHHQHHHHVPRLKENERSTNSAFIYTNGSSAEEKAILHEKWSKKKVAED